MEAECNISRRSQEPLGIGVIPCTYQVKISWIDGKGPATRTNVSFRGKAYVGIGLQVNDEIKQVNSTREPYGMIKELRNADKLFLVIHRPPPPPPNTPPPRPPPPPPNTPPPPGSKLNTILEEAEHENDDACARISSFCDHADSPRAAPKARPRRLCKGTPRLPEWWDLVAHNAE